MVQLVLCYSELSHNLIGIYWDNRYLGLFGDHIVLAILYHYRAEGLKGFSDAAGDQYTDD